MSISSGYIQFKSGYELSPIILTGGIATAQGLPIIQLTGAAGTPASQDDIFAHYIPLPGGTLVQNQIATYPFANQAIAANAIIAQPLSISMLMSCPAGNAGGFSQKQAVMISLQNALAQHNALGGTYSVVTPSFIYTSCIMSGMRDVSSGESKQVQYAWQIDFVQPLITLQAAQAAFNNLVQKLSDGSAQTIKPSLQSALSISGPSALSNVQGSLTSGLQSALGSAGVPTAGLSTVVSSILSTAVSSGFSASGLSGLISANLQLSAAAAGMSYSALQSVVGDSVTTALEAVGLSQQKLARLAASSLQQLVPRGVGLPVGNRLVSLQ